VELGRVNAFRGEKLDSDSLTGGRSQRFARADLAALLNDKIEELMDMVQRGKMDLIVMNQESASRTKAAARAWRAYEERTTKYFRVRMGRSGKEKVRTAAAKREQQGAERPLPSPPFVRSFDLFALRPVPT